MKFSMRIFHIKSIFIAMSFEVKHENFHRQNLNMNFSKQFLLGFLALSFYGKVNKLFLIFLDICEFTNG